MDKSIKWYLAGPMSNLPQFNIPTFDMAAEALRAQGYDIVSPAELDSPAMRAEAMASPDGKMGAKMAGESWGDVLARDVRLITDQVGGILFLKNWEKSRGARLEAFVGLLTGKQFGCFYETEYPPAPWPTDFIRNALKGNMP